MGNYFHDDVELVFASAYDSDERQIHQIDSLVATGIDLLIVAPNQVQTISTAIDNAYDQGIPVIVFERKTSSQKYTAFMSADNYEMGRSMGEYIVSRLDGRGNVLEIMGLEGSSPAIERHKGFMEAIRRAPGITVVGSLQGDWTESTAYTLTRQWLSNHGEQSVRLVFGANDRSAMGARRAMGERGGPLPLFCGIDGLPGQGGGIQLVRDSVLDASFIYPTYGDKLLDLAVDILDGKPYQKETMLLSALITRDNANVLLMESDEIARQAALIGQLSQKAGGYLKQLSNQRLISILAVCLVVMLLLLLAGIYNYFRQRSRLHDERVRIGRERLDFYTEVSHQLRTPLTLIEGPLAQLAQTDEALTASKKTHELFEVVIRNTANLSALVDKMLDVQNASSQLADGVESSDAAADVAVAKLQAMPDDGSQLGSILIVDDNADVRTYLRTILQDRCRLLEAADGQQGLVLAVEHVPDLIVSDVMMPVMNGLEFCQHVKQNMVTSHIPVILLTARALYQHQIEGYECGADAYITKPFKPNLLLARIGNLLRSRQQLRELWSSDQGLSVSKPDDLNLYREESFIWHFTQIVEERIADNSLSVEELASAMNLSRVQLYRKVKALTGITPTDLLKKIRLDHGRQLLLTTNLNVSEVSYRVGFTSPSYFSKCFREVYDVLPGDIKQGFPDPVR